ncbi:transporter [Methylobacterium indicum]|uniref:Transporter n=1 Tax=Methylobacterium indicum TaxID=1775910 RepID=A0ABR5HBJ3_9HYPH|nr:AEC family transporter [Methylobacterium indicum]KMO22496.1 transporter [Methylobacterium indicum]KMO23217.1 transporter [Methylobacterium indicum]KTS28973.1 transporter [Methylobacterium indicum]KTS39565.1 transporter [Methylobacterium indicum]KTS51195.1 transporter [Methylobacterium indicum]
MTGAVLLALLPIVLLTTLGLVLRRRRFLAESFWPQAERLGYFVLLPSLFFHGLATARVEAVPVGTLALTLILATLLVAGLVVAMRPLFRVDGPAFTSVFQGSVRFNNYVGVTLAVGLFGPKGIALAAICNAAIVPTVNVLCVLVFARHGAARLTPRGIARQLATNPLIVSSLAGLAFHLLGWGLPPGLEPALRTLGAASLPVGLLCVGAALEFTGARTWLWPVLSASAMKFLAMPAATLLVASQLGLGGPALTTALLFQVLPTASSAYILARQLGGDAALMAGITAVQTVLALVAMPLVLIGLSAFVPMG